MRARRLSVVIVFLGVASLTLAGCVSRESVVGASVADRASKVNALLDAPPWADVRPTGVVREFDLYLHVMNHELYPGASMRMWGFSLSPDPGTATVPGPVLRVTEGDTVVVNFRSTVAGFNHTIHWHGQHVPYEMDGVPYVSQPPIEPGDVFTYTFTAKPAGTYWYHCHVDATHHVDMGMYGVLIVDPQDPAEDPRRDREYIMVLDDMDRYHLESGQAASDNRPQSGDPFDYETYLRRQAGDAFNRNSQAHETVSSTPLRPKRDWYPVTYAPYTANYNTFIINGFAFPWTETLVVRENDVVRLRLVNAGNSIFAMHLHGHHVLVTHKDGIILESPYWVDTVLIGPGERYDVHFKADNPGLWDFHSHIGGQTANDNIFPGGAMTMLCYEGFEHAHCAKANGHGHGAHVFRKSRPSGALLGWHGHALP